VSLAVLDDHLLRDLLADEVSTALDRLLASRQPATTNLYYHRLCKSVVSARGGQLTGPWSTERRRALGRALIAVPADIEIVPMRALAFTMAELADQHRLSTLGAEAVAAALHLEAPLCVWDGDDGPSIRTAATSTGAEYRALRR
jgi:hypothetical protein